MNDSNTSGTALAETAAESAAKKAGEKAVDRGLNAIVDFVKNKYGAAQVKIGVVFNRYLDNAIQRYNQIRTLATGTTPRKIIGENSLYVRIGLNFNGEEIDTSTVEPLLQISKNLLILGTGGVGKSMLIRYLFLDTAEYEGYIPVLIELRRIGAQSSGALSILDLIYSCMKDFDVELPKEQFEYSLQLGKYLFLFDGFDEVKSSLAKETAEAIQKFSAKYPKNSFIVTSRPKPETSPLETFTVMEPMPLSKEQAVDLASRIWPEDEKTREFCRQLRETLYEKHKDFAENPLLLTMMFLTFMRNSSIPEHLSDFYKKSYDALYSAHDNQDKGCYRRDFACKSLDENEFKQILSHFCFQSYFKETYEFSEEEIVHFLQKSLDKLGFEGVKPADYLKDLRNVVCMIIKDGDIYRFSHRSFQAYFAAYYTAHALTDEQQKRLLTQILSNQGVFWGKADYYKLLMQIEPDRFAENALENHLRKLHQRAETSQYPDRFLLKTVHDGISIHRLSLDGESSENSGVMYRVATDETGNHFSFNVLTLFFQYHSTYSFHNSDGPADRNYDEQIIKKYVKQIFLAEEDELFERLECASDELFLSFDEINRSNHITEDERQELYHCIIELIWNGGIYGPISQWLSKLDEKRASLKTPSFIEDL